MKLNCEIVQDLLPLYEDGVCSESSRAAVEEHLRDCKTCQNYCSNAAHIPETEVDINVKTERKRVSRSLKRAKYRLLISNFTAILVLVCFIIVIFNQLNGVGLCFTNWDELHTAKEFAEHLEAGEYEEAASMCDFTNRYELYLEYLSKPEEDYVKSFVPMEIDNQIWYVNEILVGNFDGTSDADAFWKHCLDNQYGSLIPLDVWNLYGESGLDLPDFIPIETLWGTYMTNAYSVQKISESDHSLLEYGLTFHVMPEDMYHSVSPYLKEYAAAEYQQTQEEYGYVRAMDETEFCDYMRSYYIEKLKLMDEKGFSVSMDFAYPFSRAFYDEKPGWDISVFGSLWKEDASCRLSLLIYVQDGQIIFCSTDFINRPEWAKDISYILSPIHTIEGRA